MAAATDTIVAVATAPGRGGVGIVRLSGSESERLARRIFRPHEQSSTEPPPRELIYGRVISPTSGEPIDDGFLAWMPSPHTYTGEDVAEFQMHGSPVSLGEIVSLCLSLGARLAEPGEFTKRAFLNGRIDLVQAEAVAELINSESEAEAHSARRRLDGRLSQELLVLRQETVSLLAECEAGVDFPEENLPVEEQTKTTNKLLKIQALALAVRKTYETNRRLQTGFTVALMGRPNVGKSSLFNALLETERAIVTPIPGTTRDVLREELILSGRRVRLIDTAGLRSGASEAVEKIGIERARIEGGRADIVCLIGAADEGFTEEDREFVRNLPKEKLWWIWNKVDQAPPPGLGLGLERQFKVSALRGDGIGDLREALGVAASEASEVSADGGISNDRQKELLDSFIQAMSRGEVEWRKGSSPEFAAFEFRQAHRAISRIVGKDEGIEEILNEIFSRFCIGK